MLDWSLVSEYLAFVITVITALFFYEPQSASSSRRKLFWACLGFTAASIVLNVASVHAIDAAWILPLPLNIALNSLYFLTCICMSICIGSYVLARLYEFVYDRGGFNFIIRAFIFMGFVYAAMIAANVENGMLFFFDENREYCRGPLSGLMYAAPIIEAVVVSICFIRRRKSATQAMVRVVLAVPTVAMLLVIVQLMCPNLLMNGTIAALSNLVAFIGFQSYRVERDALTGLASRKSFSQELALRTGGSQHCQIILVALKRFSQVNQVYGHEGGDAVLFQIAEALRPTCKDGRVFRFNSVEFALIMPEASGPVQVYRIDEVKRAMNRAWHLGESAVEVDFCIADLCYHGQPYSPEQISNYLEYTILLAKEENISLLRFDANIETRYEHQKDIVAQIQSAIAGRRVRVWYQPIFYRETSTFDSAEALMRLYDENGERISPSEFIPIAEQFGLLDKLTWIALEEVCETLGSGDLPGLQSVSINLSMRQLLDPTLKARILETLDAHGVEHSRLKLEITERDIAENSSMVQQAMEDMRQQSLEFFMDDFGTGYSNFSAAMDLPFSVIKFDRSLIVDMESNSKSRLTANTLIPFFHKLGKIVLAEGIETAEQAELALEIGADRIQGFYYAHPMPKTKLRAFYSSLENKTAVSKDGGDEGNESKFPGISG